MPKEAPPPTESAHLRERRVTCMLSSPICAQLLSRAAGGRGRPCRLVVAGVGRRVAPTTSTGDPTCPRMRWPARPARVAVVGSLNVDLVFTAPRRPGAGETLRGTAFDVYSGGKGANQALAAARAGGWCPSWGAPATTPRGPAGRLEADGVDLRHRRRCGGRHRGGRDRGRAGREQQHRRRLPCHRRLGPPDVARAAGAIEGAAVFLLQLETPLAAAVSAASAPARGAGRTVVLNPAPAPHPGQGQAQRGALELLRLTDIVVPNEIEAEQLTGMAADTAAAPLPGGPSSPGPRAVLLTLGDRALLVEAHQDVRVPPSTYTRWIRLRAGDAFCGPWPWPSPRARVSPAARFAAAGALAVTVAGAGPSLPRRQEIERLCAGHA